MQRNVKLRFMPRLSLIALMVLLTACEPAVTGFCPAAVHPDACARAWLHKAVNADFDAGRAPACVKDYLDRIGDEQQAIEDNCRGDLLSRMTHL